MAHIRKSAAAARKREGTTASRRHLHFKYDISLGRARDEKSTAHDDPLTLPYFFTLPAAIALPYRRRRLASSCRSSMRDFNEQRFSVAGGDFFFLMQRIESARGFVKYSFDTASRRKNYEHGMYKMFRFKFRDHAHLELCCIFIRKK